MRLVDLALTSAYNSPTIVTRKAAGVCSDGWGKARLDTSERRHQITGEPFCKVRARKAAIFVFGAIQDEELGLTLWRDMDLTYDGSPLSKGWEEPPFFA